MGCAPAGHLAGSSWAEIFKKAGIFWHDSVRTLRGKKRSVLYLSFHLVNFSQFVAVRRSNLGNDHACPTLHSRCLIYGVPRHCCWRFQWWQKWVKRRGIDGRLFTRSPQGQRKKKAVVVQSLQEFTSQKWFLNSPNHSLTFDIVTCEIHRRLFYKIGSQREPQICLQPEPQLLNTFQRELISCSHWRPTWVVILVENLNSKRDPIWGSGKNHNQKIIGVF